MLLGARLHRHRGRACRARSHSSWIERFVPTTETVQVLVLSSFFQLILCLLCHWALPFMPEAEYTMLTWYLGIVIGALGACFQSGFNRWVRGESLSLRAALAVDKINKKPGESDGWCEGTEADEKGQEGDVTGQS